MVMKALSGYSFGFCTIEDPWRLGYVRRRWIGFIISRHG